MMKKSQEILISTCVIAILIIFGGGCYYSYCKPFEKIKEPVIVSENMFNIETEEDDGLLQIVKREKIDSINGLNYVVGMIDKNQVLAQIGLKRKDIEDEYKEFKKNPENDEIDFLRKANGGLYKIDLNTLEKSPIIIEGESLNSVDIEEFMSPDGRKLYYNSLKYLEGETCYNIDKVSRHIYDIKSNTNKEVMFDNESFGNGCTWSRDSKYIINIAYDGPNKNSILRYDVKNNNLKKIPIKSKEEIILPKFLSEVYSNNGNYIYFTGKQVDEKYVELMNEVEALWEKIREIQKNSKKSQDTKQFYEKIKNINNGIKEKYKNGIYKAGIFRLNVDTEEIYPVMVIPNQNDSKEVSEYRFSCHSLYVNEENKTIIMQGNINGEDGLFIYNIDSKEYNKVAESLNDPSVPFYVSPDENKIVYATFKGKGNDGHWTVYAANIEKSELVNKILLVDDIENYGLSRAWWSNDSKKLVIFQTKPFDLDTRVFKEKGIIHIIYFK